MTLTTETTRAAVFSGDGELSALSDEALVDAMREARRRAARWQAREVAAVAELAARREAEAVAAGTSKPGEFVADEISAALTVTGHAAAELIAVGLLLRDRLPWTRAAFGAGVIDLPRVRVIATALTGTTPAVQAQADHALAAQAAALTTGQLRRRARAAVIAADPDVAAERTAAAVRVRRVESWDNSDGTADLAVRSLPAERVEAITNRLNAAAAALKTDGDGRPVDAIRADLATDLLCGLPLSEAARVRIIAGIGNVGDAFSAGRTGSADRADNISEIGNGGNRSKGSKPGDAGSVGYRASPMSGRPAATMTPGNVRREGTDPTGGAMADAGTAGAEPGGRDVPAGVERQVGVAIGRAADRRLAALVGAGRGAGGGEFAGMPAVEMTRRAVRAIDRALAPMRAAWCRGTASDAHDRNGYRPPAALRRLIIQRHPRCVFPTCNQRAENCDIDHTVPWHKGGPTCACNLAPTCRHHHRLKQDPRWTLVQPWPGTLIWISPAGKWYTVESQE